MTYLIVTSLAFSAGFCFGAWWVSAKQADSDADWMEQE